MGTPTHPHYPRHMRLLACEPVYYMTIQFHQIQHLKQIESSKPKAMYICKVCNYYCDNYEVVKFHVGKEKHRANLVNEYLCKNLESLPDFCKEQLDAIQDEMWSVIFENQATQENIELRHNLADLIRTHITEQFPDCSLTLYGSTFSTMGLLEHSDLNLKLSSNIEDSQQVLYDVALYLESIDIFDYHQVIYSEIPKLSFGFKGKIRGSIVVCSQIVDKTAKLFKLFCNLDDRVNHLATALKVWGKKCDVINPEKGTLASSSLCMLLIYYLQQISPPVLPTIEDFTSSEKNICMTVDELLSEGVTWKTNNNKGIGDLFVGFFKFYTTEFNYKDTVVDITKKEPHITQTLGYNYKFFIYEPFNQTIARVPPTKNTFLFVMCQMKTTYGYLLIPQTRNGPLFGAVKEKPILDPAITHGMNHHKISNYIEFHLTYYYKALDAMMSINRHFQRFNPGDLTPIKVHNFIRTVTEDQNYNLYRLSSGLDGDFNVVKLHYVHNIGNMSNFNTCSKKTIIFTEDAVLLKNSVNPDCYAYSFNSTNFSGKRWLPIFCNICRIEGHKDSECPELTVYKREPIGSTSSFDYEFLDCICVTIFKKFTEDCVQEHNRLAVFNNIGQDLKQYDGDLIIKYITLFGSSDNGCALMRSDVDISIGVELERGKEYYTEDCGQALKELRNFLIESKGIDEKYLIFIPAKIPILKFIDEKTGLKAELSINNELGIENTKLLKLYTKIDLRAKYLCVLMKVMARESQMGNRGLSSYAYTLLVIFYLQKCEPPVLPVLQELPYDDDHPQNIIQGYDTYFLNNLENVRSCWPNGEKNVESVSTLWVDLLCFYSERFDFGNQVVSIRQSKPLLKSEKRWYGHNMAIEDPFDVNRNFGVNISRKVNNRIFNMFVNARNRFATATSTNDNLEYYINIPTSTITQ